MLRTATLATVAMLAFAANSVLARLALAGGSADAFGYTGLRLLSGAAVLALLVRLRHGHGVGGGWPAAAALLGYALAFSLAYLMLGAATGALILFATVQFGILGWAILKRDRPSPPEWLGIAIALAALAWLLAPGLAAPSTAGAALMLAAGLCWAAYTLIGKGSASPLADTAGNFIRCLPAAIPLLLAGLPRMQPTGALCAIASGAIASGLGYAVWYAVLPRLARASAAYVQLTVPVIAAAGALAFLGEPLTGRLLVSAAGILGGVVLALLAAERRRAAVA
jgi:drug/metabolite transporter (DMT)-like permease